MKRPFLSACYIGGGVARDEVEAETGGLTGNPSFPHASTFELHEG